MVSAQDTQPFTDMEYQLLHVKKLKLVNLYYNQLCNKMMFSQSMIHIMNKNVYHRYNIVLHGYINPASNGFNIFRYNLYVV